MRIKEPISKQGYFWLPSHESNMISGLLTITDGGKIELEILGMFNKSALNDLEDQHRIIGVIENQGFITLEDCWCINSNYSSTVSKSVYRVRTVLIGHAYKETERMMFSEVRFSVEGIDEWVGISGATTEWQFRDNSAMISYRLPDPISFDLPNEMRLQISFDWSPPTTAGYTETKITQKVYFSLTSQVPLRLNQFTDIVQRIVLFLCFAVDETLSIDSLIGSSNDIFESDNGKQYPIPIFIYYQSLPFSSEIPNIKKTDLLFEYEDVKSRTDRTIKNWLAACENGYPAIDIYFATRANGYAYLESRFLALAQCFEIYHRRTSDEKVMDDTKYMKAADELVNLCPESNPLTEILKRTLKYGNELSLRSRVKKIIQPFKTIIGDGKDLSSLLDKIVKTRNYLTHYDRTMDSTVNTDGGSLHSLYLKMDLLFQLHLLHVLGFDMASIQKLVKNNRRLKFKLEGN